MRYRKYILLCSRVDIGTCGEVVGYNIVRRELTDPIRTSGISWFRAPANTRTRNKSDVSSTDFVSEISFGRHILVGTCGNIRV